MRNHFTPPSASMIYIKVRAAHYADHESSPQTEAFAGGFIRPEGPNKPIIFFGRSRLKLKSVAPIN